MKRTVDILVDITDVFDVLDEWLSEEDASKVKWQISKLDTVCISRGREEEEE